MIYMLDTNIIIYYLRGMFPRITHYLRHTSPDSIRIPSVVIAELEYGAQQSSDYNGSMSKVSRFLEPFDTADFDMSAAASYGYLRSTLQKSGSPIGANDMLIASTALSSGAALVTHNIREFSRIPDLKLCDWTE